MFEFVEGEEPDQEGDLAPSFEELGEIAARTHNHSISWTRPDNFERFFLGLRCCVWSECNVARLARCTECD